MPITLAVLQTLSVAPQKYLGEGLIFLRNCAAAALLAVCSGLCAESASAQQADNCGDPFVNAYGPFDYRSNQGPKLKIVEDYHFTPNIETLVRGNSGPVGGELAYTLRAFPNHHRALVALMKLEVKEKTQTPNGANISVECYLLRAVRFRPDDTTARMLLAKYLAGKSRRDDAIKQLESTAHFAKDNGFTHYNIGLIYLEIKEYPSALEQAHKALALGVDRPLLKEKLQAAGQWRDPDASAAAAAAAAASGPASAASQ